MFFVKKWVEEARMTAYLEEFFPRRLTVSNVRLVKTFDHNSYTRCHIFTLKLMPPIQIEVVAAAGYWKKIVWRDYYCAIADYEVIAELTMDILAEMVSEKISLKTLETRLENKKQELINYCNTLAAA